MRQISEIEKRQTDRMTSMFSCGGMKCCRAPLASHNFPQQKYIQLSKTFANSRIICAILGRSRGYFYLQQLAFAWRLRCCMGKACETGVWATGPRLVCSSCPAPQPLFPTVDSTYAKHIIPSLYLIMELALFSNSQQKSKPLLLLPFIQFTRFILN